MLSRVSQRKTNTVYYHLHVESKKYSKLVNLTKKTPTDKKKKAVVIGRKGERGGVAECEGQTIRCERSHRAKWKTGY